jgi:hypothetical protein
MLLSHRATFDLATRIQSREGVQLGEAFTFLSGLYFRGKLAYAQAFGHRSGGGASKLVITTDRGLLEPEATVRRDDLLGFCAVDIATGDERYTSALRRDAQELATQLEPDARVVLLGSIATGKYADTLLEIFGDRLLFPVEFVGRGDMSRGGLLLRCVAESRELEYRPVLGAVRRGKRPPRLERKR